MTFPWGSHESLLEAAQFVETIEKRQSHKIAYLEEVTWRNGWLSNEALEHQGIALSKNGHGQYLLQLVKEA